MIRFLQQDSKATKFVFGFIISAVIVLMVIFLVPGIFDGGATNDATVYATVRNAGMFGRFAGDSTTVTTADVQARTQQMVQQAGYPPMYAPFLMPRVGQQMVERAVLVREAERLGLTASDDDVRRELHNGQLGAVLFPNGQFVGQDKYMDIIQTYTGMSVTKFEQAMKEDLEVQRLRSFVTGGINVSESQVRDEYMKQGTKVQFDYAVISSDDLKKSLNPTDAELQSFFTQSASRYANAVPEERKVQFVNFLNADAPGAKAAPSDAAIQAYYSAHQDQYKNEDMVHARHILIAVPQGSDAKTDAAAKAKAEDVLKQVKAGGDFAALAKKYSDDPGSKDKGGDLGMQKASMFVPVFRDAAMKLNPGQTSDLVKSDFGYHIIQTIEKKPASVTPLADVKDQISQQLQAQASASAAQNYAAQLAAEAKTKGLAATAAAHNLHVETTGFLAKDGTIPSLEDSTALMNAAFSAAKGAAPQTASTGEGYAIFQVTDIQAAHAPTFAEWKSHVLDDYKAEKTPELLNDALNKLDQSAKQMGDLKKAAAEQKLTVKTSDLVGRDGQVPDVGAMSGQAAQAFDLPKGGVSNPINLGANGIVLQVTDKQQPSADDLAKNLATTRDKMLADKQDQAFMVFAGEVMDRYQKAGAVVFSKKAAPGGPFGN